jgi:hypothetical protein
VADMALYPAGRSKRGIHGMCLGICLGMCVTMKYATIECATMGCCLLSLAGFTICLIMEVTEGANIC